MGTYIKYKRFEKETTEDKIDEFLEELIKGGWEIIHYHEDVKVIYSALPIRQFTIVVICGKTQSQVKNVL
jgi:hypothetical protein